LSSSAGGAGFGGDHFDLAFAAYAVVVEGVLTLGHDSVSSRFTDGSSFLYTLSRAGSRDAYE
jgi:hypothetical protein